MKQTPRTGRPSSRYWTPIFLTIGLLSCSTVPTPAPRYPTPPLPETRAVEVKSELPVDGREIRVVVRDGSTFVVVDKSSRFRFVTFRDVLLNDQANRAWIDNVVNAPGLEVPGPETAPANP